MSDRNSTTSYESSLVQSDMTWFSDSEDQDNEWRLVTKGMENADPVCVLIRQDKIFYKYIKDVVEFQEVVEFHYDGRHEYDADVVEFFNTLCYLGGRRTVDMLRGPMFFGQGRGSSHDTGSLKMNLRSPSEETCRKSQAGYTTKSGVIKSLSRAFVKLSSLDGVADTIPLINNDQLKVVPCVLANDGTALKLSIQFDARTKTNVCLDVAAGISFVKKNPEPSPQFLSQHIVTEVLVSSVTALDNTCSLPCSVHYAPKSGKTAAEMKQLYETYCKIFQIFEACQEIAPSNENVLELSATDLCQSECNSCIAQKRVCSKCEDKKQVRFYPCLRACSRCIETGKKCVKIAILILSVDCEEGNKPAMVDMIKSLENDDADLSLQLMVPLPDERGNLAMLRMLRNRQAKALKPKCKNCFLEMTMLEIRIVRIQSQS